MSPAGEVVASVGVEQASALWVEDAIEAGDERARGYVRDHCFVDPCQNLPWCLHVGCGLGVDGVGHPDIGVTQHLLGGRGVLRLHAFIGRPQASPKPGMYEGRTAAKLFLFAQRPTASLLRVDMLAKIAGNVLARSP